MVPGCTRLNPASNPSDFGIREAEFVLEIAVTVLGKPRGHVTGLRDISNLVSVFSDVLVRGERERRGTLGMVTGRTFGVNKGRNISRKARLCLC